MLIQETNKNIGIHQYVMWKWCKYRS